MKGLYNKFNNVFDLAYLKNVGIFDTATIVFQLGIP